MRGTEGKLNIFIDTSTLEDCKYHLEYPPLQRVIEAEYVILHTTCVTLEEIRTRISGQVGKHRQAVADASKWMTGPVTGSAVWKDSDQLMERYRKKCKYEHNGRGADLGGLVDLYIRNSPPFSAKKPDEFRDAMAALSLHHWAEVEGEKIYIVAKDPDWLDMCSTFRRFTYATLGDLHAHLFKLDAMSADLDMEAIASNLLGEKGKPELDAELGRVVPQIANAKAMDVDYQFVDVSSIEIRLLEYNIVGVEMKVRASFSGSASVRYRDETVEGIIVGVLLVACGVEYAFHKVDIENWHITLPREYPARVYNLSKNDQS